VAIGTPITIATLAPNCLSTLTSAIGDQLMRSIAKFPPQPGIAYQMELCAATVGLRVEVVSRALVGQAERPSSSQNGELNQGRSVCACATASRH
jgi:hypothetical protein